MIPNPKHEHRAKVIRWIDADTVVLHVKLDYLMHGNPLIHRLLWLDAPERYTDGGKLATAKVNELAPPGSTVFIRSFKEEGHPDSLYRWLAEVFVPGAEDSINEYLLRYGYAEPFMQNPIVGAAPPPSELTTAQAWIDLTVAASRMGEAVARFQNAKDAYVRTDPYGRSADD
jgi:endonuclease YncB( thermonuclease family)